MTPTTLPPGLAAILDQHRRVGLTGPPMSGKTTLANLANPFGTGHPVIHTDDLIRFGWSEQPSRCMERVAIVERLNKQRNETAAWILEGVQVPRCVRAGLALDAIVWFQHVPAPQHAAMTKGMITVLQDVIRLQPDLPIYMYDRDQDTARRFTGGTIDG